MSLNTKHDPSDSFHFPAPNFPQIAPSTIQGSGITIVDIWGPYSVGTSQSDLCYVQVASLLVGFANIGNLFLIGTDSNSEGCFIANIPNVVMSSRRGTLINAIDFMHYNKKPNDRHPSYQQWMNTEWEIHQHLERVVQKFY